MSLPNPVLKLARCLRDLAAAIGILFLVVTFTPVTNWVGYWLAGRWNEHTSSVLIVLSGAEYEDGFLAEDTVLRCHYAVRVYKRGGIGKVIVTGGGDPPVALGMADLLAAGGIPREKIVLETRASSTRENAEFVASLLKDDRNSKLLLTSDYHMHRAAAAFRKAGLEVETQPIPDAIKRSGVLRFRWSAFMDEALEISKIAYYKLRGWT